MTLIIKNARILTAKDETEVILKADLCIKGNRIHAIETRSIQSAASAQTIDAQGRVLIPGFIDAHTHALWAGDRLDEFELKLQKKSYLEILESGGGIMATVGAVRSHNEAQLASELRPRLERMLRAGITTVEVKSGYGLTTADELKMLAAIKRASSDFVGTVVPTALLGHAIDREQTGFVDRVIQETLEEVHAVYPSIPVDAYCEKGAWTLQACQRLFERAIQLGHPIRVHADQFNCLGMTSLAVQMGALSVDHLEASSPDELRRLAESETFGVMLPISGFHLDGRFADGRTFVDQGGRLVLGSNYNPGSAPSFSMPFVIALAVRHLGLTVREAILCCTNRAASLLGFSDRGVIEQGKRADLVLLDHRDERMLGYEVGTMPIHTIICNGQVVSGSD